MLEVGSIVGGKLRIERILGKGGMGVVAVATHLQLEQPVAVKVLHEQLAGDDEGVARFLREARASARLRSEHVCKVFDTGQLDDGAPYLVMELLEGQDLAAVIAGGALPVATAVDHVLQACVAVAEAHALGIVHRDLKPANLFLTRRIDGSPLIKVLDFGIAKAPSAGDFKITRTSTVMGSPGYMSPEQLRSAHDADARSDIWALGVILYELVSGRLPFRGDSITELAVKVTVDPPEPLAVDPPSFAAIVYRCLEKSAEDRYPTVAALAADLAPLGTDGAGRSAILIATLGGGSADPAASGTAPVRGTAPAPAPPVAGNATTLQTAAVQAAQPPGDRTPMPRRSRAGILAAGVALVAAVAAVAVFMTRRDRRAPEHPPRVAQGAQDTKLPAPAPPEAPPKVPEAVALDAALPPADATAGDAEGATGPADPAAVRDKLRALAATHDARAVLEIADLDRGDPEVAAIVDDARRQFLAQQARAIDALVKQGQCARARAAADDAHKVVADDTTLEPRARACKPHAAPPEAPATLAAATSALDHRELARALELAEKLVAADPGDLAAARVAALAACAVKDVDKATRYAARLRGGERSEVRARCEADHIDVGTGPGPGATQPGEPGGEPGADLEDAQNAARAGDWNRALELAESTLQRMPRNPIALRVGVVAACHLKQEATARSLLRRVPLRAQRALRQQCADQGVLL